MKKAITIILTFVFLLSALSAVSFVNGESASAEVVGFSSARVEKVDLTGVPNILDYMLVDSEAFKITGATGMEYLSVLAGYGEKFGGKTLYLANDIDMTGSEFTPVPEFWGTFDGQGHIIDNLVVGADKTPNGGGMFIRVQNSTIKNLIIGKNSSMTTESQQPAGFIAQNTNGTATLIDNVYICGNVTGEKPVGGLVGMLNGGTIVNSTFAGNVLAKHNDGSAGGMIGIAYNAEASVRNCRNAGKIESTGYNATAAVSGGMIGRIWAGVTVIDCINNGTITSKCAAGGMIGAALVNTATITVRNCKNFGSLLHDGGNTGIVGSVNVASFVDENNSNTVGGTDNTFVLEPITPDFPETDPYVPGQYDNNGDDGNDDNNGDGNDNNGDDNNTAIDKNDEPDKTATTTASTDSGATDTAETEKAGGCGSTIGGAAVVLACAGLAVAVTVGKKKK